jgi:hypothetical protein
MFISTSLFSQDNSSQKITYSKSVEIDFSKTDLKNNAFVWFQSYFKNASSIISKNTETELIANPHFRILNPKSEKGIQTTAGIIQYTIKIHFSEGKYTYELTDFYLKQTLRYPIENWKDKSSPDYKQKYVYYLEQVDIYAKQTIASLERAMK